MTSPAVLALLALVACTGQPDGPPAGGPPPPPRGGSLPGVGVPDGPPGPGVGAPPGPSAVPRRERPPEAGDRPNFLVIDIDSLRADRVDLERQGQPVAPRIRRLARTGTMFTQMISQAGWTLPGLASLLTGRYPVDPGVEQAGVGWVEAKARSLPEILGWYGYQTAVFWGGTISSDFEEPSRGFAQVHRLGEGPEPPYDAQVREWLVRDATEPFFLFVHNIDLHAPRPPIAARALHLFTRPVDGCAGRLQLSDVAGDLTPTLGAEEAMRHAAAHYDGSLHHYDTAVGAWLDVLNDSGLAARTVVILTSNHGEDLGEHGIVGHGLLFDTVLRVPLLVRDPAVPRAQEVDTLVQTVDLAPTILARAGVPVDQVMDGHSLLPLLGLAGTAYPERPVVSLVNRTNLSVRDRTTKLHFTTRGAPGETVQGGRHVPVNQPVQHKELYDLVSDPGELHDLQATRPKDGAALDAVLTAWMAEMRTRVDGVRRIQVDDAQRKMLQERGYWEIVSDGQKAP